MKITYDADANAAYIYIAESIAAGESVAQTDALATPGGLGEVILDFDRRGHLLGIEILGATGVLPPAILAAATPI
ncbi:DUF2283 domain-containing protein [Mycetocola spongiae]|uniref:DUF2283 domain-containing protein n=1 Tax=Mycetocola spongiae TaxID=2859226 RepID=UPI001CF21B65|nr:DUF2283 domain-containing protein [Mycetocola spongiae]UCR88145.1 DUF2283 domain-containing protein [Mycetocola spongiae]